MARQRRRASNQIVTETDMHNALRNGDAVEYLKTLHECFGLAIYRRIGRQLKGREADQDDVFQETMKRLAKTLKGFSDTDLVAMADDGRALRLPFTIAQRVVADHYRLSYNGTRGRERGLPDDLPNPREAAAEVDTFDQFNYVLFLFDAVLNEREKGVLLAFYEFARDYHREPTKKELAEEMTQRTGKRFTAESTRGLFRRAIDKLKPYTTDRDRARTGSSGGNADASQSETEREKGGEHRT